MAVWSCLVVALAVGVAACGGDDSKSSGGGGTSSGGGAASVTIYSSLPLQGDSRPQSQDVVNGEKMALEEHGGKAGKLTIKYVSLDDATASAGKWEPGQVSANARKAVGDKSAVVYLGEFNSGASAVSIPIVNQAGLLQISPSNTYVGLTRSEGADKGEPDKYYPSGQRTYGRVVPADHIQAAAQVSYMKDQGCKTVYILNDKEVYGKGIADAVQAGAGTGGLKIAGNDGIDTKAANFRALAGKVKGAAADCFFFGGITQNKGVQVFKDVAAANPSIKMFGPDGVAESAFTEKLGDIEANVFVTAPTLDPKFYPDAAQKFYTNFKAKFGKDPEPYAIYGYEAMSVALDAIERAGDKAGSSTEGRKAIVDAFFQTKGRDSVLGTYDIDENGDTTLSDYGGYTVKGGKLTFSKVIKAAT
jgi:branched-chain amino acid transport system substrate-binding protein